MLFCQSLKDTDAAADVPNDVCQDGVTNAERQKRYHLIFLGSKSSGVYYIKHI